MHQITFLITLALMTAAAAFSVAQFHFDRPALPSLARGFLFAAVLPLVATGFLRYNPDSPMDLVRAFHGIWGYFYLTALLMIAVLAYLPFSRWRGQIRIVMVIAVPFITLLLACSIPFLDSERRIAMDVEHVLLPIHIVLTVIGELLFLLSAAGSVFFLIAGRQLKKRGSMKFLNRLPTLESIDNFNRWTINRSLAFMSAGLVPGILLVWMHFSAVSLRTPKEIVIYLSWFAILALSALRGRARIPSGRVSRLTIALFVAIFAAFGYVNIFITTGFHSFR